MQPSKMHLKSLALIALLLAACGTAPPTPDPVPVPTPDDPFRGAIVDCSTSMVVTESPLAEAPARACLVGESVAPCLVGLTAQVSVATVACVVRTLGVGSNRRVLSEQPGTDDTTIDNAARAWIRAEGLGYR